MTPRVSGQSFYVVCDVCGSRCELLNENGEGGYDKQGVWRDICPDCVVNHSVGSCINCQRLFLLTQLDYNRECYDCASFRYAGEKRDFAAKVRGMPR